MSDCTERMLAGWVVATRHSPRILRVRISRILSAGIFFLVGGLQWLSGGLDVRGIVIRFPTVLSIQNNTETLAVAGKEIELEVNADQTKYMVMSRDQNAGRRHNVKNERI